MHTVKQLKNTLRLTEVKLQNLLAKEKELLETKASFKGTSVGNQLGEMRKFEADLRGKYSQYRRKYVKPHRTWENTAAERWYHEVLAHQTLLTYHDLLNQVRGEIARLRWLERERHRKIHQNKQSLQSVRNQIVAVRSKIASLKTSLQKLDT